MFFSKTSGFSVFNPDILQIFYPKKSHLFQPFFDPTLRPLGVSQTLKGCSKSKLAIAFLNWSLMSQEGDDLEEPKNPKNPTNPTNPTNVMCTIFFHDFHHLTSKTKKRNQKQSYRIKVAACGVQSNTPQTGNSLVSHPFSWRRNLPTTEKPLEKPLTIHPLLSHSIHHSTLF